MKYVLNTRNSRCKYHIAGMMMLEGETSHSLCVYCIPSAQGNTANSGNSTQPSLPDERKWVDHPSHRWSRFSLDNFKGHPAHHCMASDSLADYKTSRWPCSIQQILHEHTMYSPDLLWNSHIAQSEKWVWKITIIRINKYGTIEKLETSWNVFIIHKCL